jgi:hypothetical protein
MSIDVRAEGPTQAITFSNYDEEDSVFKLQRRGADNLSRQDSISSSRDAGFEAVDVDVVTTFSFGVSLEGVGISIVNKKMQELIYASFRGLTAKYSDSTTNVAYDVSCKWIQVGEPFRVPLCFSRSSQCLVSSLDRQPAVWRSLPYSALSLGHPQGRQGARGSPVAAGFGNHPQGRG